MNKSVMCVSVLALSPLAVADFVVPDGTNYPWVRGVSGPSSWAQWETFSTAGGPNGPDVGTATVGAVSGSYGVGASGTGATVLGSGNIYAAGGPLSVTVTVPSFGLGGGASTTLLLQLRTQGTEVNPATVRLNGLAATASTELSRVSLGGQGAQVETLWRWELPGSPASITLTFTSFSQFFSLDRVAVDQWANIPGPGPGLLLGAGVLASRRRRR